MYQAFSHDLASSYSADLSYLLDSNLKVLVYNGQNDYIVNTACVLDYLDSVSWRGARGWKGSRQTVFDEYGEILGWYKKYETFTFVLVYNAGHLLPSDQPRSAYVMMRKFIQNDFL